MAGPTNLEGMAMGVQEDLATRALQDPDSVVEAMVEEHQLRIGDVFVALQAVPDEPLGHALLDTRSANALRQLRCETWGDVAKVTVGALWEIPAVGRLTVHRILAASAARNSDVAAVSLLDDVAPADSPLALSGAKERTLQDEILRRLDSQRLDTLIREVAAWVVRERGAERLSDLITLSPDLGHVPKEIRERFGELSALPLGRFIDLEASKLSPTLAAEFVAELGERANAFTARHLRLENRPTLADLGAELGLTRERVRQLTVKASERAEVLRSEARFAPLTWRAIDLAHVLGAAIPAVSEVADDALDWATRGLEDPTGCTAREFLLWLAGPYELDSGWLVRPNAPSLGSLTRALRERVGDAWLVPLETIQTVFRELGLAHLDASELGPVLRGWRHVGDGRFVRWTGSVGDKAEIVLRLNEQPLLVDEINARIGEGHSPTSLRNSLASDKRFVRLDKANNFGLREWGLEEYSGIAQEIIERIERAGSPVDLRDLIIEFVEQFGVSETSVRLYAACPAFVLEKGRVRLRSAEEAYELDTCIAKVRGLYVNGLGQVIFHVPVDKDLLRGSGRGIPEAAVAHLGLRPGLRVEFEHPDTGATVVLTWPTTSTLGPALGSVRALAEHLKGQHGDQLRLIFDPATKTCDAELVDSSSLSRLTGLQTDVGQELAVVAAAIQTDPIEVRAQLQARGDNEVLALLPSVQGSAELDEALSEFGNLLG